MFGSSSQNSVFPDILKCSFTEIIVPLVVLSPFPMPMPKLSFVVIFYGVDGGFLMDGGERGRETPEYHP